jgi:hypothetical protein
MINTRERTRLEILDQVLIQTKKKVTDKIWNYVYDQTMIQIWNQIVVQVREQVMDQPNE